MLKNGKSLQAQAFFYLYLRAKKFYLYLRLKVLKGEYEGETFSKVSPSLSPLLQRASQQLNRLSLLA